MLKKLTIILSFFISSCYCQDTNTDIREYKSFKDGTTYFITYKDAKYNKVVGDILSKYWTVNKFEMINSNQIEKLKGESSFFVDKVDYSFSRTGGTTGALNMAYQVPKLAMFKDYKKTTPKGVLALVELENSTPLDMLFAIQFLQSQINLVFKLNTKSDLSIKDVLDEINDVNKKTIQSKKLYLIASSLKSGINTDEEFKKIYNYKFEFTTQQKIDKAIEVQDDDVVYLKVINYRNLRFVLFFNAKNSELLYGRVMTGFNQAEIGPKFFKDVNE